MYFWSLCFFVPKLLQEVNIVAIPSLIIYNIRKEDNCEKINNRNWLSCLCRNHVTLKLKHKSYCRSLSVKPFRYALKNCLILCLCSIFLHIDWEEVLKDKTNKQNFEQITNVS